MINYMVINALTPDYEKQINQIKNFTKRNNIKLDKMILFVDDNIVEKKIKESIWTKEAIIIKLNINLPEYILSELEAVIVDPSLIIFPNNIFGIEISSRISTRLNIAHINDIISFEEKDEFIVCRKKIYMNLVEGEYIMHKGPIAISIDDLPEGSEMLKTEEIHRSYNIKKSNLFDFPEYIQSYKLEIDETEESLTNSNFVIIMGRGFKKRQDVESSIKLIESLGAEYGVTRPIAMNGWVPLNRMIGISGEIINPKICIILGSSCAGAFYAGVEDSEFIVNINIDSSDSLLAQSDVYINSDCVEFINALAEIIHKM